MAQCNECQTTDEDLNYFWQGDIEEDYDMGDYDCLCENCFNKSNIVKINQKGESNAKLD